MLCGCGAAYYQARDIKKQHLLNYEYPSELAKDCAKVFPVKDSVGKPVYIPANNVDYSKAIDTILILSNNNRATALSKNDMQNTSLYLPLSGGTGGTSGILFNKIDALRAAYKPCKPDTIKIPHYIIDQAKIKVLQDAYKGKSDSLIIVKTQWLGTKKNLNSWRWIAISGIVTILLSMYLFFSGGWLKKLFL